MVHYKRIIQTRRFRLGLFTQQVLVLFVGVAECPTAFIRSFTRLIREEFYTIDYCLKQAPLISKFDLYLMTLHIKIKLERRKFELIQVLVTSSAKVN